MNLTPEAQLKLRRMCQEITYKPRPMAEQPCEQPTISGKLWCEDWELIEVLKFFFLGKDTYYAEAPPRRLRGNAHFNHEKVERRALGLWTLSEGNVDKLVELIRSKRADNCAASRVG